MRRFIKLACLITLLACSTGCSFNGAWRQASIASVPSNAITGRWEGTWVSEVNHHHGRLRCILTQDDNGAHRARFHATFLGVLSASYTVPLQITRAEGGFKLHGEQNLGSFVGGVYTYDGSATPTNFFCTYSCKSDHGTFQMTRPKTK